NMERFVGQNLSVLLEEKLPDDSGGLKTENLWFGRLYCQAPEVDGSAVFVASGGGAEKAGEFVVCRVNARRGFDLEVGPSSGG
ncbi:MAG: hypothetical protein FWD94_00185, partial [Treponema sp.]|nr:hypothetical protein [Treponema sp.]